MSAGGGSMGAPRTGFDAIRQLQKMLQGRSIGRYDVEGAVLDYIGRTGVSLSAVTDENPALNEFFGPPSSPTNAWYRVASCCREHGATVPGGQATAPADHTPAIAVNPTLLEEPQLVLGHPVNSVVWQLSDIHFGKFNHIERNPRELGFQVARVATDYRGCVPDVILISGDLTSTADDSEFEDAVLFIETLSTSLWGRLAPERVLVVPGNHDVRWGSDGTADRLAKFAEHIGESGACITPFRDPPDLADGVQYTRSWPSPDTVAPLALVRYPAKDIEFLLLVSPYFSGSVPQGIRSRLADSLGDDEALRDLLRDDEGGMNREYLFGIASVGHSTGALRLGVVHHNPVTYGVAVCVNPYASQLLQTLQKHGTPVLLHGHTHLVEDPSVNRMPSGTEAYPVPCPTLSGTTLAGGPGMLIHAVGVADRTRYMSTLVWELSQVSAFNADGVTRRYRYQESLA